MHNDLGLILTENKTTKSCKVDLDEEQCFQRVEIAGLQEEGIRLVLKENLK